MTSERDGDHQRVPPEPSGPPPQPPGPSRTGGGGNGSPAKKVLVGCLAGLGVVVLVAILVVVLVFRDFGMAEHERRLLLDKGDGKQLVDKPCAKLESSLKPAHGATGMKADWSVHRGNTVVCDFTLSSGGAQWTAHVRYVVRQQPRLFGEDRRKQIASLYERDARDDQTTTHDARIENLGIAAYGYLLWDDGDSTPTSTERNSLEDEEGGGNDTRSFNFEQWTRTGKLSRVARVLDRYALVEARIDAKLPVTAEPPGEDTRETEYRELAAGQFTPPIEDLLRKAYKSLE